MLCGRRLSLPLVVGTASSGGFDLSLPNSGVSGSPILLSPLWGVHVSLGDGTKRRVIGGVGKAATFPTVLRPT